MQAVIVPTSTPSDFIAAGAAVLEKAILAAIALRGRCVLGLSGGSTPGPVYEALSRSRSIEWERVHVFAVDERCVPQTHEDSNRRMIEQTLLARATVPDLQRHFPNTMLSPSEAARTYDRTLRALLPDGGPDVVVLGIGSDGHVASLFPPLATDDVHAAEYAIATHVPLGPDLEPRFPIRDRITTTLTLLRMADVKVFLLRGTAKKEAWKHSIEGIHPLQWPASLLMHHAIAVVGEE